MCDVQDLTATVKNVSVVEDLTATVTKGVCF